MRTTFFYKLVIKFIFVLSFSFIHTNAIAGPEAPEYIRTKNWKLKKINGQNIELTADIVFFNPNKIKAKLQELDLDILLNEKLAGNIVQENIVQIKGKSSFDIPISLKINIAQSELNIGNILSLIGNQSFLLNLNGFLKAKVFLIPFKIKIDEEEELKIEDFF